MKWIFFFNGWGMDETALEGISLERVEVINYPYDNIENLLEKHQGDTLYAVAWSFGAYYFSKLPQDIQNRFQRKIALNGLAETLGPYGILPKMCQFTLDTLNEESLKLFYENIDFQGRVKKSFSFIREELDFFIKHYTTQKNNFDFAWIGEKDRIFSAKKLIKYYEKEKVPYQIFPAGHYPFSYFHNLFDLLGDTKNDL